MSLKQIIIINVFVALFDQQPLLFCVTLCGTLQAAGANQRESTAQFEAMHLEVEFALAHRIGSITARRIDYLVLAPVPDDHGACSIITFWNDSLEIAVF